jgi:hypothetical protein
MLALLEENPKFDRSLAAGPALGGKQFPKVLPGFCDFIGMIQDRIDVNGRNVYPPMAIFESDGSFMSKWTGFPGPGKGPLDIQKILDVAHGRLKPAKGGKHANVKTEQLELPLSSDPAPPGPITDDDIPF